MKRKYLKALAIYTVAALLAGSMPAPVYAAEEGLVQVTEESTLQEETVQAAEETAESEEQRVTEASVAQEDTVQDEEPGTTGGAEENSQSGTAEDTEESEPGLPSETDAVYMEEPAEVETSLAGGEENSAAVYSTEGTYRPYEGAAYSLTYTVVDDGITISGITDYESKESGLGKLVIPETIDGISVTSIGEGAFYKCDGFTGELVIPAGVTSIGGWAFEFCSGFTGDLVIPAGVTSIGDWAFEGCYGFKGELVISEGVTSIGEWAFAWCGGFTGDLVIPAGVTSIGGGAFLACSGFTGDLVIPAGVTSIGKDAFNGCWGFTGDLVIPKSVTSIENDAFHDCRGFTGNLVIPESVTSIGSAAFRGCSGFTGDLVISEGVTSIGYYVFSDCSGFTGELVIPAGVTSIGWGAFEGCSGFTGDLVIPESVTSIGERAFYNCSGFTGDLVIPAGVTSIGYSAFNGCSGFTGELVIPAGVTSIGDWAFAWCDGFTGELVIPEGVTSIGELAFCDCSGFTGDLVIPEGVTSIGECAFEHCSGFTGELVIPAGVKNIGKSAFSGCSGLKSAVFLGNETVLGEGVFAKWTFYDYDLDKYIHEGCVLSRIYGHPGSTSQTYAEQMNIPFISLTDVENSVNVDSTAAGVSVSTDLSGEDKYRLLSEALKSAGQSGTDQEVSLNIQVKKTTMSDDEQKKTQACAEAEEYTVGQALDISMILSVGGETSKVEQLTKPVRFVIEIPKSLQQGRREFAVVRLHNGEAEILPDLDSDPSTITIETDRFSSYTLAYKSTKGVSLSGAITSFGDDSEGNSGSVILTLKDGEGNTVTETTVSGDNTSYTFSSVESGKYTLQVSKKDHVTREYDVEIADTDLTLDVKLCRPGDIDGNGSITVRDKKMLFDMIKKGTGDPYQRRVGDVSQDGDITVRDKKMLFDHITGKRLLWE